MSKRKSQPKGGKAANPWPQRLLDAREAAGVRESLGRTMYQAEAAAKLGVSRRSWIAWELGETIPSNAYARLIDLIFPIAKK